MLRAPKPTGQLLTLSTQLNRLTDPAMVAQVTVAHLVHTIKADWAEVVLADRQGCLTTLATIDADLTDELRRYRNQTAQPPALEAHRSTVVVDSLRRSPWPDFAAVAMKTTPVRSVVMNYFGAYTTAMVIPVYDHRPGFFTRQRRQYVQLVARTAEAAFTELVMRDELRHLDLAIHSHEHVGHAVGILAAHRHIDLNTAFELLRLTSSHTNRKLRDIATEVIATGDLPSR